MDEFNIIERVVEDDKLPRLKRAKDGFSRQDVVDAFQSAFEIMGGTTRLALWANHNPDKFFPLYAKLLPSTSINFGTSGVPTIEHAIPPTPLDQHPGSEAQVYVFQKPKETPP